MRAICIYDPKADGPFRGILFLEGTTTPDEAIAEWSQHVHGEDPEEQEHILVMKEDIKYFFMDPISAVRISEAVDPDYSGDSVSYAMLTYRVNLCAMFEVRPSFSIPAVNMNLMTRSKFVTNPDHILT